MMHRAAGWVARLAASLVVLGAAHAKTFDIRPGPDADARLQQAFAEARAGDAIVIRQGVYTVTAGLRLTADRVTVRGDGPDRTILNFSNQGRQGAALTILSDTVTLRDFAVDDPRGEGVSALGADGLEIQNLRIGWANPPAAEADALAVADAANVVVARAVLFGAPGAGLRLSGVRNAIVRETVSTGSGAGLALHNVRAVDVNSSRFSTNAFGVLVRDRPGAASGESSEVRIFRNRIENNAAGRPTGPDAAGGLAPSTGVGIAVMGARGVWVQENVIAEHPTVGVLLMGDPEVADDPSFGALPRDVAIVYNSFGRSGYAPAGGMSVFDGADIVWDGAEIFVAGGQVRSVPVRLSIVNNIGLAGAARFSNLQLAAAGADPADAAPDPVLPDPVSLPEPKPVEIRR